MQRGQIHARVQLELRIDGASPRPAWCAAEMWRNAKQKERQQYVLAAEKERKRYQDAKVRLLYALAPTHPCSLGGCVLQLVLHVQPLHSTLHSRPTLRWAPNRERQTQQLCCPPPLQDRMFKVQQRATAQALAAGADDIAAAKAGMEVRGS